MALDLCFELRDAGLTMDERVMLEDFTISILASGVTVLLGPCATGKSLLLRTLAGHAAERTTRSGDWLFRGRPLSEEVLRREVAWLSQRPRGVDDGLPPTGEWLRSPAADKPIWLLDEPERGLSPEDRGRLVDALRRHREHGAAIVVTHDVSFARAVADDVVLVVAKRVRAQDRAPTFFDAPPNELAERFVQQGNCWCEDDGGPSLPSHFRWIVPGRLAGMGRPGLLGSVDDDLAGLRSMGIRYLVSLEERPFPPSVLARHGIEGRHMAVRDMGIPSSTAMATLCGALDRRLVQGDRIAAHCRAGLGRTGTLLASLLVWQGLAPDHAVSKIRGEHPGYIQSDAQMRFVEDFARYA